MSHEDISAFIFDISLSVDESTEFAELVRDFATLLITAGIAEACELSLSLDNNRIFKIRLETPVKPENWRQVLTGLPSVTQSKSDKETPVSN